MYIEYISHSCFILKNKEGKRLIIDPFITRDIYPSPTFPSDIVLISHQHEDHSNINLVEGATTVITGAFSGEESGFFIHGVLADHGTYNGKWLGMVICYKVAADDISILHLSDIGVMPEDEELANLSPVDILLVPVGEHFTLTIEEINTLIDKISPSIIIPMHYATAGLNREKYPLSELSKFTENTSKKVKFIRNGFINITKNEIPQEQEIWVLEPRY